jgi:hypothetical protein
VKALAIAQRQRARAAIRALACIPVSVSGQPKAAAGSK